MNNEDWIKKLHSVEVIILDELDRICKKNDINYFLIGGTLIGAVRHQGFIPWDDDIDIGMTRKDFNKFIQCCQKDLSNNFLLDSYPINKKSFHLYAKLRYKDTLFVEKDLQNLDINHEIWIDIFPYDNVEQLNSRKHIRMNMFRKKIEVFLYLKIGMNLPGFKEKHSFVMFLINLIVKLCSRSMLIRIATNIISKNKNNNSKYISTMTGFYSLEKETHLRDDIFPTVDLEFEGKKYPCPKEYDKILTKIYGDYMTLPPVEKQITHKPVEIKFPDGQIIKFKKGEGQ